MRGPIRTWAGLPYYKFVPLKSLLRTDWQGLPDKETVAKRAVSRSIR